MTAVSINEDSQYARRQRVYVYVDGGGAGRARSRKNTTYRIKQLINQHHSFFAQLRVFIVY